MVSHRYPNNTNIEKTNLNNVNKTSREENINDIRRKIKESLEEKGKYRFIEPKDSGIENNLLEKNTDQKGRYSINSELVKCPGSKRYRLRKNELLTKEIAKVLEDSHSLEHSVL